MRGTCQGFHLLFCILLVFITWSDLILFFCFLGNNFNNKKSAFQIEWKQISHFCQDICGKKTTKNKDGQQAVMLILTCLQNMQGVW